VLLIGAIILVVGTTIAFTTVAFIDGSYGSQASQNAEAVAAGGVEDAQLRLARGDIANGGTYTVTTATGSATVTVTPPSAGLATVLSIATVLFRTRKIQAVFAIDPTTGQVSQVSWNEVQ
jgi:hypothetical protein